MKVQFFRQLVSGPEIIGTITLKDGRLVADPAEAPALRSVLSDPVHQYNEDGTVSLLDSRLHPKDFLRALPDQYHGTYFWARAVED